MNRKEKLRAEGWGGISAAASGLIGWGILVGIHQEVNAGLLVGVLAYNIGKVVINRA